MDWVLFTFGFVRFLVGCYWYWVCFGQLGVRFGSGFVSGGAMFGIGFVCLWLGKYVIMPFNSREGVSVGLFK